MGGGGAVATSWVNVTCLWIQQGTLNLGVERTINPPRAQRAGASSCGKLLAPFQEGLDEQSREWARLSICPGSTLEFLLWPEVREDKVTQAVPFVPPPGLGDCNGCYISNQGDGDLLLFFSHSL